MTQPHWQDIKDLATREAVRKLIEDLQRQINDLKKQIGG